TFFFFSYEGLRVRQSVTRQFSVPTARVRNGDFLALPAIYDPLTTSASGIRRQFSNNSIPQERLDPAAIAFLQKLPLPNLPGESQNYVATPSLQNDNNQFATRIDRHLNPKDSLFGRYYQANFDTVQPFGSSLLNETLVPGFGYSLTTRTKNVAIGETHVFTPKLVSELRIGFLRVSGGQQSENQGANFALRNGIQGIAPATDQAGYPSISFSGAYSTAGDPTTLFTRRDNSFDFMENLSWIRG